MFSEDKLVRSSWSFWSLTWSSWLYTANRPHWNSLPVKESRLPKHNFNGETLTPKAILTFVYREQPSSGQGISSKSEVANTAKTDIYLICNSVSSLHVYQKSFNLSMQLSLGKIHSRKTSTSSALYWAAESTHTKASILSDTVVWNSAEASILTVFLSGNAPDNRKTNLASYLLCKNWRIFCMKICQTVSGFLAYKVPPSTVIQHLLLVALVITKVWEVL